VDGRPAGTAADEALMQRAIQLARGVRRSTAPNPWVGAVVVREGAVVGEGATAPPGGPHAEVRALRAAAERAEGATVYVTLEPCSHQGRTPPCVDSLLTARVARVVVALEDPDPRVTGRGLAALRAAGVAVDVGVGADEARRLLAPYLHHRRTGRAYALLKTAVSLDGRVAAADGTSHWITGPEARADGHRLRAESQAVVVGAGTALADRPTLTARDVDPPVERQPLRVVLDARGRVPAVGELFDPTRAPTLVVTTEHAAPAAVDAWRAAGAKVEVVEPGPAGHGVDLPATLDVLGADGVLQALIEGGPRLHAAFVEAGLVDSLVVYVSGTVLGERGLPSMALPGPDNIAGALRYDLVDVTRVGPDARLELVAGPVEAF
jgi:diaminohydroxyphosphoribosylaminopyrimidine deaminase/5-amino-6-(5-phosphoribosylamino)uracil reductase